MENRKSKDDEVSREVWKAVETGAGKFRLVETKRERKKGGSRKEARKKRGEEKRKEKTKERKKDRSMKNSRRWEI